MTTTPPGAHATRPRAHGGVLLICCAFALALPCPARGQAWEEIGPAPMSWFGGSAGRISAIVCSPTDPDRYFVAGADGGVWRTDDGGLNWVPLTDHMPASAIGALIMDPTDENIIYAGTGEANFANHSRYGLGIYRTANAGATWEHLAEETFAGRCFSRMVIDPRNPRRIFASVTRAGGFPEMAAAKGHPQREGPVGAFRSDDSGRTWTHIAGGSTGLPELCATDLAMDPADPDVLYAAIGRIFGHTDNGLYKSTDGGLTWARLGGGLPTENVGRISVAVAPSDPSRVYALYTHQATPSGGGAVNLGGFRSDDGGQTWTRAGGVDQATYGWFLSVVSVKPDDPDTVFYGGLRLTRWSPASGNVTVTPPHVDLHALAWDAAGRLIAGDDGGVHRSVNLGDSWENLNDGLGTAQFYAGLSTHPTDDEWIIGGTQDNGTARRDSSSLGWTTVLGGDGGWTQVDQTRPNIVYAQFQGGGISRSTNGGNSFNGFGGGLSGRHAFYTPYVIDPSNPDRLLAGRQRVFERFVGAGQWTAISGDVTNGVGAIRTIAIAPSDPSHVYLATNDGNVGVSRDGGRTFDIVINDNPGWPRITREIFIDPDDPETMYLAVSNFGTPRILRTRDAGRTFEPLDAGLPDVPVNVVAVDTRRDPPVIYAGMDDGLMYSLDEGFTWRRYGVGLANAAVIDIRLEPGRGGSGGRMVIGTQGRGAWVVPIVEAPCPPDCDGDGALSFFDFLCFQSAYLAGDRYADFNADGRLDFFDFLSFQGAFLAGCP